MIVEFYGLSGTGKTTLSRRLGQEADFLPIRIDSRTELALYNLLFLLSHPLIFTYSLFQVLVNAGSRKLAYYKFMNVFLHVNAKCAKARRLDKGKIVIIDQGYAQNVISLFENKVDQTVIKRYLKHWPRPDILVRFSVPSETRLNRLSERERQSAGFRSRLGAQYEARWRRVTEENDKTFRAIPLSTVRVVDLCGDEDVASVRASLTQYSKGKIIYATNARIPSEKAHSFQIAKMCEEYARLGYDVELWLPYRRSTTEEEDIFTYYGLEKNWKVVRVNGPDFVRFSSVLGHWAYRLQSVWFFLMMAWKRVPATRVCTRSPEIAWIMSLKGKKVIFEAHYVPEKGRDLLRFFIKKSFIVANSSGTAGALAEAGLDRVLVAPNGVDIERFAADRDKFQMRKEVNLPLSGKIVMYVGHFYDWKGADFAVAAWKQRFGGRKDIFLAMVGGRDRDIARLKSLAGMDEYDEARGIGNIIFLGHRPKREIPAYLMSADVLLLPNQPVSVESERYTSPIKMFEYMGSGRPIVASDLPSLREILDEDTAVFFAPNSAADLNDKIENLLNDERKCRQISAAARMKAEKYTWAKRAQKIIQAADAVQK